MISEAIDSKFPLRMTQTERLTVEKIQADAERAGITASLNDVVRHLIRSATAPVPETEREARDAIHTHWANCTTCDPAKMPACLDGLRLQRAYTRIVRRAQSVSV
jgi:hypothetical protein